MEFGTFVAWVVGIVLALFAITSALDNGWPRDVFRFFYNLYLCRKARKTMLNKWYKVGWKGERGVFLSKSCSYQTSYPEMEGYGYDFRAVRFSKDSMRIEDAKTPITDLTLIEKCEKALACSLEEERLLDERNAEEARMREEEAIAEVNKKIMELPDRLCKTKKLNS
jgi:hypothetical protein